MALKLIKNKIAATKKTGQVTKAMEAVSAVKMRKSQERARAGRPYAEAATRILHRIAKSRDGKRLVNQAARTEGKECYIVITSDKGLAGSLNSSILKDVEHALSGRRHEDVSIIAFGKKAVEHFTREGYAVEQTYTNVSDDVSLEDSRALTKLVTDGFNNGTYRRVSVAYQNFVSTFEQYPLIRQVLPLDETTLEIMLRDITPKEGKYADDPVEDLSEYIYTVEPSPEEIMRTLSLQLAEIMVYHALLENKASEHSARMVAMKNATDKANDMTKSLTLEFNKARQAAITAEVSEITGGIEAMSNS